MMIKKFSFIWLVAVLFSSPSSAIDKLPLRIAVQTSGTLDWELAILNESTDFQVIQHPVATAEAAKIALQSGAVDMIVSDFLWVSQTRNTGSDFTFYPYSNTAGALVVSANSAIQEIKDLAGKRLGIAGGELDKNWLLLQAVGKKQQVDLAASVEKTFGAPPLINEQLKNQRVDAVLTHWHFAAQLEAQGYKQLIDGHGLQQALGIFETVPTLGYVFKQSWADQNKGALKAFFSATKDAKSRLCSDDILWHKTTVKMESVSTILRKRYCDGRFGAWTDAHQHAAEQLYSVLFSLNPKIGSSSVLSKGTFWIAD